MRPRRFRGEEGASLTLVMAFLGFFGVLGVATLALTGASFETTSVVRARTAQLYAADAGLEYAVGSVRADRTKCDRPGTYTWPAVPASVVNGRSITYSCEFVSGGERVVGSPLLGGSYIGIITGNNGGNGMYVAGGNAPDLELRLAGSLHVQGGFDGFDPSQHLTLDGDLTGDALACIYPDNIVVEGDCSQIPSPPTVTVPSVPLPTTAAPAPRTTGSGDTLCTILYPGRYTQAPTFTAGNRYYLASGTYYFDNTGDVNLGGTIFGGAKGALETQKLTGIGVAPCATDAGARTASGSTFTAVGTGATIALGGNAVFRVQGAAVEIYSRAGAPAGTTPGVGIFTTGTQRYYVMDHDADVVIHGLTYMPNAKAQTAIVRNAEAGGASMFYGGFVFSELSLLLNNDDGAVMSTAGDLATGGITNGPRVVRLTSVAASTDGGLATTIKATVAPDGTAPVISNWRKTP